MKKISIGIDKIVAPAVVAGCMRFADFEPNKMNRFIHRAIELGVVFFDHADIYGDGRSEEVFGSAWHCDGSLKREDMIIQSKCGIRQGFFLETHFGFCRWFAKETKDGLFGYFTFAQTGCIG